jgi:type II secretory pathway pseudopilin PulG
MLELTVAIMLLAVVLASLGPLLSWIRQQRRTAEDRQLAVLELANAAERLSLTPYRELTAESLQSLELPAAAAEELPGAVLTGQIADEADPAAKRITLELAWRADGVRPIKPLRLVVWRFPDPEAAP